MRKNKHLRIVRTEESPVLGHKPTGIDTQSVECQIEIPGIGRLRTGEYHPNCHGTSISKKHFRELINQQ